MLKKILKDIALPAFLTLSLLLFLIVTNIIHETGHYLVARMYGYDATLRYNMTYVDFADSSVEYDESHGFWIAMGGAIQTIILGFIGLNVLNKRRKSVKLGKPSVSFWLYVFLSLGFISYTVNFFLWIIAYGNTLSLDIKTDEMIIATHLNIPEVLLLTFLAVFGIIISIYVFKNFIPKKSKAALLLSILLGYFLFFILWIGLLGPVLMP
jgi:hypothetical protein